VESRKKVVWEQCTMDCIALIQVAVAVVAVAVAEIVVVVVVVALGALVVDKGTVKVVEPRHGRSEGTEQHWPWVDPREEGLPLLVRQPASAPHALCPVPRAGACVMPWQKNPFL
jgi:hypothetical protein